jgi:hypothetical protein
VALRRWHQEAQLQARADDARFQEPPAAGFHRSRDDAGPRVQGEEDAREDGRNQDQDQEAQDCQDRQQPPGAHDQGGRAREAREPPPHNASQDRRQEHPQELDFFFFRGVNVECLCLLPCYKLDVILCQFPVFEHMQLQISKTITCTIWMLGWESNRQVMQDALLVPEFR